MFKRNVRILGLVVCVVMCCPGVVQALLYAFPEVVIAPTSAEGDFGPWTPGTTTAGFQEAIDYCVANHLDLYIKGGYRGPSYTLLNTVHIPACANYKIDGGMYNIAWWGPNGDDMISIDSGKNCHYNFCGLLTVPTDTGYALRVKPQNPIPNDGSVSFTNSSIRIEVATNQAPFGQGAFTGHGVIFDTSYGPITSNDFYLVAGIQIWTPDSGYDFSYNHIQNEHLSTNAPNATQLHLGTVSSRNIVRAAIQGQNNPVGVKGLDIWGCNNIINITVASAGFANGNQVTFSAPANGNVVNILPSPSTYDPSTLITDGASYPTNKITWTGSQVPISRISVPTGVYTYNQRLYPATAKITGGVISQVTLVRAGVSIPLGAWRNDVLMSPQDQLQITSSVSPYLYIVPRIR